MKTKLNPWPLAIISFYVVFGSAMAAWITFAVRQNMDLVTVDYYAAEMRHQREIDRFARTRALPGEVKVGYDGGLGMLNIQLPGASGGSGGASGRIQLYRPSDARLDRDLALVVGPAGTQQLHVPSLQPGSWTVKLFWTVGGVEYRHDESIVVGETRR